MHALPRHPRGLRRGLAFATPYADGRGRHRGQPARPAARRRRGLRRAGLSSSKKTTTKTKGQAKKAKTAAATASAPENPASDGRMSGLDAAAKVLAEAGQPLNCKALVERMLTAGWCQTSGKTPQATIYAAMPREERLRGKESRFRRVERGMFELAK